MKVLLLVIYIFYKYITNSSLCIYCTKVEKIRISDLSPTITIQQYYCMFMLKYQNALSAMKTHSFSFRLGLSRTVCDIFCLKSASEQRNKITNHRDIYYCGIKVFGTDFNSKHFMNHCHTHIYIYIYIYSTYIKNGFTQ